MNLFLPNLITDMPASDPAEERAKLRVDRFMLTLIGTMSGAIGALKTGDTFGATAATVLGITVGVVVVALLSVGLRHVVERNPNRTVVRRLFAEELGLSIWHWPLPPESWLQATDSEVSVDVSGGDGGDGGWDFGGFDD